MVNALCDVVSAYFGGSSDVFNWVLPVVVIVAAVRVTIWYPDHVTGGPDRQHAASPAVAPQA